mmetsp:Transcript_6332/g.11856  ORF Transcript_6332/g.11856 Transcript_6332/m.11856 type:complete len:216 (+) Transcript_6332:522-1169(+)
MGLQERCCHCFPTVDETNSSEPSFNIVQVWRLPVGAHPRHPQPRIVGEREVWQLTHTPLCNAWVFGSSLPSTRLSVVTLSRWALPGGWHHFCFAFGANNCDSEGKISTERHAQHAAGRGNIYHEEHDSLPHTLHGSGQSCGMAREKRRSWVDPMCSEPPKTCTGTRSVETNPKAPMCLIALSNSLPHFHRQQQPTRRGSGVHNFQKCRNGSIGPQ